MKVFRAASLAAAPMILAPLALAQPAQAQVNDEIVLDIMRQCARIDDATARLACYDNNIRSAGGQARNSVPGQMEAPSGSGAPVVGTPAGNASQAGGATGFGRETIRTPDRFETPAGELDELSARVAAVDQRGRGLYVVTLQDGARWEFAESVDFSYRPPREGSQIRIERGSLGSFLLRFDSQPPVQVRRIR